MHFAFLATPMKLKLAFLAQEHNADAFSLKKITDFNKQPSIRPFSIQRLPERIVFYDKYSFIRFHHQYFFLDALFTVHHSSVALNLLPFVLNDLLQWKVVYLLKLLFCTALAIRIHRLILQQRVVFI